MHSHVCVCVFACVFVCVPVSVCVGARARVHVCVRVRVCARARARLFVCAVHVCRHVCKHVYMQTSRTSLAGILSFSHACVLHMCLHTCPYTRHIYKSIRMSKHMSISYIYTHVHADICGTVSFIL